VFAGLVGSIERHLVAADGFLFPSHFEAFALAEIEAAALGLRLYLTPHYGSEMILRDPENGRVLPWDVDGIASVLDDEICKGRLGVIHHQLGEALSPEAYAQSLRSLYLGAIERKMNASSC
jgi:glycosyltransferase involved in cell wall biosynthesis